MEMATENETIKSDQTRCTEEVGNTHLMHNPMQYWKRKQKNRKKACPTTKQSVRQGVQINPNTGSSYGQMKVYGKLKPGRGNRVQIISHLIAAEGKAFIKRQVLSKIQNI